MKMNYPLRPKPRKNPQAKVAVSIIIGFFVFLYIMSLFQTNLLLFVFGPVVSPVWKIKQNVNTFIVNHVGFFQGKDVLVNEITNLRAEVSDLSAVALERDALKFENDMLKGLPQDNGSEVGRVLSSPAQSLFNVVALELAPSSQVEMGDIVYGAGSVTLGTIVDKSGNIAHMQFFSNSGTKTTAQLAKDGTSLELVGQGGGTFLFQSPRDLDIKVGDAVILPRIRTSIIGTVQAVEPIRADSFKNVYISYPMSIFRLTDVRISHER